MGEFIRFYSWGLSMKFHMAVYTLALVFFKAIFNALAGEGSVSSLTMLQMLLVSMAVAILESFLFPEGRELEPSALRVRTVWWGLLCNLGFVGGALALGWFSNVPLWGGIFLVLFLEWGLSAMWFGLHVALRRDTRSLNRKLELEGVLMTMFDSRTNLAMQVAEEVKRYFPGKVYATVIPRNVRLSEAPSHGKPITAYDRSSRGYEAYTALAEEFLRKSKG